MSVLLVIITKVGCIHNIVLWKYLLRCALNNAILFWDVWCVWFQGNLFQVGWTCYVLLAFISGTNYFHSSATQFFPSPGALDLQSQPIAISNVEVTLEKIFPLEISVPCYLPDFNAFIWLHRKLWCLFPCSLVVLLISAIFFQEYGVPFLYIGTTELLFVFSHCT